ncbi:uncharacterized protein A1O5_04029 [Cladophialophora psammophila CBS 110553]|uniref:4-coumarate-CoA ligase n=1 Tax=Cladophialophora psammophila CBS 110553 TaxID=1182543 RepID=W9X7K5_9EURO|nr:uncharacterized protein A1O5_04029 [Cladophialophora psammophila CBS 110553]EXJ72881.1 hypothetical protein A1O5_04029 [Cladophialophora psammophila CBS 110553]
MVSSSPYPLIHIPNVDLWEFLFERQDREWPDTQTIYVSPDEGRVSTFCDVKADALRFGASLVSSWNWQKGDALSLFLFNSIHTPALIWGCHWAGGVVVPSSPTCTAREYAFQLVDSRAKAIVTSESLLHTVVNAAWFARIPKDRILVVDERTIGDSYFSRPSDIQQHDTPDAVLKRHVRLDPTLDHAFICYTSGTTGLSKGVALTHTNIIANVLQNRACDADYLTWNGGAADGRPDRIMAFLPFYHIYGLTALVHVAMFAGLTAVVMPSFDLKKFCEYVEKYQVTFSNVVPPVVLLLAKHPIVEEYDLSSLKMLMSGAAPLTKDLAESVYHRIGVPIKQGYGLTETSPTTHLQSWNSWNLYGSIGQLLPNQLAKYVDLHGNEVPKRHIGELWIKGPNIFRGYVGNPSATRDAFSPDGFFRTGDIGYEDEQGNFFITGRIGEIFKVDGYDVSPAELEGLLLGHPKINDVAVMGIYDGETCTERPRAYVFPVSGVHPTPEIEREIFDWLNERVSSHKRLTGGIRWVMGIPKTSSGKILRRVLRDMVEGAEKIRPQV